MLFMYFYSFFTRIRLSFFIDDVIKKLKPCHPIIGIYPTRIFNVERKSFKAISLKEKSLSKKKEQAVKLKNFKVSSPLMPLNPDLSRQRKIYKTMLHLTDGKQKKRLVRTFSNSL